MPHNSTTSQAELRAHLCPLTSANNMQLLLTFTAIASDADQGRTARVAATAHRRTGSSDHCVYSVTRESTVVYQQIVWSGIPTDLPSDIVMGAYDFGQAGNFWDGSDSLCINHTTVGTLRRGGRGSRWLESLYLKSQPEKEIYISWEWLEMNGEKTYLSDAETNINLQGAN